MVSFAWDESCSSGRDWNDKIKKKSDTTNQFIGVRKINDSHYSVIAFTEHTLGCTVSMDYLLSI